MKNVMIALAATGLAAAGTMVNSASAQRHQPADVRLSISNAAGRTITPASMPPQERQRVTSLQSSLQHWGNQQSQRVIVTINCTYPPLRCEITISF